MERKGGGEWCTLGAAPSNSVRTLSSRQGQLDAKGCHRTEEKVKANHGKQENGRFPQSRLPLPLAATSGWPHGNRVELRGYLAHLTLSAGRWLTPIYAKERSGPPGKKERTLKSQHSAPEQTGGS